jgi:hypothetical protein
MTAQLLSTAHVGDQVLYRDGSTHHIIEVSEPDEAGYMCQTSAKYYHTVSGKLLPGFPEPHRQDIVKLIPKQSPFEEQLLAWLYANREDDESGTWLPEICVVERDPSDKELTFDEFTDALRARVLQ